MQSDSVILFLKNLSYFLKIIHQTNLSRYLPSYYSFSVYTSKDFRVGSQYIRVHTIRNPFLFTVPTIFVQARKLNWVGVGTYLFVDL